MAGEVVPGPQFEIDEEVDRIYNEVTDLLNHKDFTAAIPLIAKAKQKYPDYPDPLELEARWAEMTEKWQIAAEAFEALVNFKSSIAELTPETIEDYRKKAEAYRIRARSGT